MHPSRHCLIVHGCPDPEEKDLAPEMCSYDKHWMPWTERELTARGIPTERIHMPNPWAPDYEAYKQEFETYPVSEQTILIGHSCGSAFLVRWLGETKHVIDTLILVAPWKIPDPGDEAKRIFYTYTIDPTIASRVRKIVMFTSPNEEEEGKESLQMFHAALGGTIIDLLDHGHYTLDDMGTDTFPELIQEICSADKNIPV